MLSHHAPTRAVLQRFFVEQRSSDEETAWVYRRYARPRQIYTPRTASAENHYFSKDPFGRTEQQIETLLNERFEAPFHGLLPLLCSPLVHLVPTKMIPICASFVGNMFLRSKPRRIGMQTLAQKWSEELSVRLSDELTCRRFAALVSLKTGQPVEVEELRRAALRMAATSSWMDEANFFLFATLDFGSLSATLEGLHWSICTSGVRRFVQSDTAVALLIRSPLLGLKTSFGYGIGRLGSEWYFPFSPHRTLRVSQNPPAASVLPARLVEEINGYLVAMSRSAVYTDRFDPRVKDVVDQKQSSMSFFGDILKIDLKAEISDYLADLTKPPFDLLVREGRLECQPNH